MKNAEMIFNSVPWIVVDRRPHLLIFQPVTIVCWHLVMAQPPRHFQSNEAVGCSFVPVRLCLPPVCRLLTEEENSSVSDCLLYGLNGMHALQDMTGIPQNQDDSGLRCCHSQSALNRHRCSLLVRRCEGRYMVDLGGFESLLWLMVSSSNFKV